MSLLFDQNLSRRLPRNMADVFPGSEQVATIGLDSASDREVWNHAAARGLSIVSKDADFHHLATILGTPPKVIWLRIGNGPTRDVESLLRSRGSEIKAFLADPLAAILELP